MNVEPSKEGSSIASEADLQAFASQPGVGLNEALRGVLAETALTGRIRYDWQLLKPLFHALIDSVFSEYAAAEQVEVGPPRPMPCGSSPEERLSGLHALLDDFAAAPFTVQRLCEVLLEPRKQYRQLYKLAYAIEKLLLVTSTRSTSSNLPPRPALSSLGPVNENPPSPYLTNASGGGIGSGSRVQQGGQSHLPNGREDGGDGSPTGAHPPTGRSSAVFRMFLHAEAATAAAAAAAAAAGGAAGSGGGSGGAAEGASGDAASNGMLAEEAAEAELAKQFVEDALRTDPEPGEEKQPGPIHASPAAAAGASSAPATEGQQLAAAKDQGPMKQQEEGGGAASAAIDAAPALPAAEAEAGVGSGSDSGAAGQQQAQQAAPQGEPGAAMDIDGEAGGEAAQEDREQGASAGEQAAAKTAGEQMPAGVEGMETGQ